VIFELGTQRLRQARAARRRTAAQRLAQVAGAIVPGTLLALAGLHAAWALGCRWPGGDDRQLAEYVLSRAERERLRQLTGRELPPAPLTWAVAGGLLTAAAGVRATASGAASAPHARRRGRSAVCCWAAVPRASSPV
jgi:hypothetical protein